MERTTGQKLITRTGREKRRPSKGGVPQQGPLVVCADTVRDSRVTRGRDAKRLLLGVSLAGLNTQHGCSFILNVQ